MALSYVGTSFNGISSGTSVSCALPTGTTTGDLMFGLVSSAYYNNYPVAPSGREKIAEGLDEYGRTRQLYYKVASSSDNDTVSYTRTGFNGRGAISIHGFRGTFNTSSPVYDYSNVSSSGSTAIDIGSINILSSGTGFIFGGSYGTSQITCTKSGWTECYDNGSTTPDFWHYCYINNSLSTGETGDMTAALSTTSNGKKGFGVSLNNVLSTGNPGAFFQMF